MNMLRPHILVSGASIAGPALAYWLIRAGCKVTVVERAPALRTAGQGIDIRDAARDVVKRMGIFELIRNRSSHEEGTEIIDSNNRTIARLGVDEWGEGVSLTCDVEILRGELAKILFDVTKDQVDYIFGEVVESLEETEKEVRVNFAHGTPAAAFDLVVAADGIGSKIRGMVFGNGSESPFVRSLNSYATYFSMPRNDTDTMWSRAHWFPGGRNIWLRPDNIGRIRPNVALYAYDNSDSRLARLEQASKQGIPAQKAVIQELFQDAGWETSRVLRGMHDADDFYMQQIAQVRMNRWSSHCGRVTVVGDAGYAVSPIAGGGTTIAFIGAYVLAGEISRQLDNIPAALLSYERVLRPFVEERQKLPPGIPWMALPQSKWGVRVLETGIWGFATMSGTALGTLFSKIARFFASDGADAFKLPDYEAFR